MKSLNFLFQWFFWMFGIAGLGSGVAIAMTGSWTRGIAASILLFGTMVPLGNFFKSRRELARANAISSKLG
jgi:hypothetical protein